MRGSLGEREVLFSKRDLRSWLERRRREALETVGAVPPDEALERPPEQIAEEIVERYAVAEPRLLTEDTTGRVDDQPVDVAGDVRRAVDDRSTPTYVSGTRIRLHVPYEGPAEALRLQASTYTLNPPQATVNDGAVVVFDDVPADTLERDRGKLVQRLHDEVGKIETYLDYARADITASNQQLREEVYRAAKRRREKVLADRDTAAVLGVPLQRDDAAARTYRVQPVRRKRVTPTRRAADKAFTPEPALIHDDFAAIVADLTSICHTFERLAVTYAAMAEERLRDQILAMLGNVYGPATGESFSKRGKSDIYLPWDGGNPVFLAECKWWTGPKIFAERDLPQLLDRYVVWRDTHAAMVLFIGNKDATAVVDKATSIIQGHDRFVRRGETIDDAPVFVLHKGGDPDREIHLALVTAVIHA